MQAEGAKAPPDCRRIVIRLRYGIKGRCDRWATCTGEECLVNVHPAKSPLDPGDLRTLRSEDKGQAAACPDRMRAILCNVQRRTTSRAVQ